PEDDLPHLFERFYRVDKGRSKESGGTGLGLSITKHIIQLHDGKVWAESKLGEWTKVSFSLHCPLVETGTV
ncbi:MAG: cell wall metabolism sensor histidine kinase WalK, partial [Opitutales bacterium]|nr:cell wall metabolism sensor histidine kinase WalK [Opitutales bacterium]